MSVTKEVIEHVANLSKLHLSDNEKEKLVQDMMMIIDYLFYF